MNNVATLRRLFAVPWAMREDELSLFPQMLMGAGRPRGEVLGAQLGGFPRAGKSGIGPRANSGELGVMAATSWKMLQWDPETGELKRDVYPTQAGYEVFNVEGLIASLRGTLPEVPAGTTVLLLWGMLGRGWAAEDRYFLDPVEYDEIVQVLQRVPPGNRVVLWFRSPGGLCTGVTETAQWLRGFARGREVVAFTDDVCGSAAYNLAAQCSRIVATQSAAVGSIGVYVAYYDFCEYLKKQGVELYLWKAGDEKGDGLTGNPVSKKMDARMQKVVADARAEFVKSVTEMRRLEEGTMQGQCFYGADAVGVNLVDGLVGSAGEFFGG